MAWAIVEVSRFAAEFRCICITLLCSFVQLFCVVLSCIVLAPISFFVKILQGPCEDLAKIVFRLGRGVSVNNFTNVLFVATLGEVIAMTWRGCCAQLSQSLTYSCLRFVSVLITSSS